MGKVFKVLLAIARSEGNRGVSLLRTPPGRMCSAQEVLEGEGCNKCRGARVRGPLVVMG